MQSIEQAHKKNAVDYVEYVLLQIAEQGREVDNWERLHLIDSIGSLHRGAYVLSILDADKARAPEAFRKIKPIYPSNPLFEKCDLQMLWEAFIAAKSEPIKSASIERRA